MSLYIEKNDHNFLGTHYLSYRVSELEVRNLKRLEMIEKPSIFCISCLYLQEYKKEFAFLTKFHYFESRGGLN